MTLPARRPQRPRTAASRVLPFGRIESWGSVDVAGVGRRRIRVYVPAERPQAARGEPGVVVLFDGQNVFDDAGSFAGGWHAHRAAERVATRRRPAPIVVGVDHGFGARARELSPFARGGGLDALVGFLRGPLAQALRERFAIPADPARWIVGGASLGGLAALYAHFTAPELFGGALCMSPSLGLGGRRLLAWVATQPLPWTSRIYLDSGAREGRGTTARWVAALAAVLSERGYDERRLRVRRDARGRHAESSWRRRLPGALRFLLR